MSEHQHDDQLDAGAGDQLDAGASDQLDQTAGDQLDVDQEAGQAAHDQATTQNYQEGLEAAQAAAIEAGDQEALDAAGELQDELEDQATAVTAPHPYAPGFGTAGKFPADQAPDVDATGRIVQDDQAPDDQAGDQ